MIAQTLLICAASIAALLSIGHVVALYVVAKLQPTDTNVRAAMERTPLRLSDATTTWRAWVGFNNSHALGLLFFGLTYIYLALARAEVLLASPFLLTLGALVLAAYVVLARVYWFAAPTIAGAIALCLFVAGIIAAVATG